MTTLALAGGLLAYRRGDHRKSQLFQRARVGFQAFTIVALVAAAFNTSK
jgi:hypothetical protein